MIRPAKSYEVTKVNECISAVADWMDSKFQPSTRKAMTTPSFHSAQPAVASMVYGRGSNDRLFAHQAFLSGSRPGSPYRLGLRWGRMSTGLSRVFNTLRQLRNILR